MRDPNNRTEGTEDEEDARITRYFGDSHFTLMGRHGNLPKSSWLVAQRAGLNNEDLLHREHWRHYRNVYLTFRNYRTNFFAFRLVLCGTVFKSRT